MRTYPVFFRESAAGDNTMEMVVIHEGLTPCVKNGGDTDLGVQLVASKLQQRLGCAIKEQFIEELLILLDQGIEKMRQGKNDVKIGNWQKRVLLLSQPLLTVGTLTGWAMTVTAGMRLKMFPAAMGAGVKVSAELAALAAQNCIERFPVMKWQTMRSRVV